MKSLPLLPLAALLLGLGSAHLRSATIAEDTFKSIADATPGAVTSQLTWKKIANTTLAGTTSLKGDAGALQADCLAYGKFYTMFPTTEIPVGGTLKATIQFRYAAAPESAPNALRVGLAHLTDPDNPNNTDGQPCYLLFLNPGGETTSGNAFAVEEGTDGSLGGGKDFKSYGAGFPSIAFGTDLHTLTFSLTRTESGIDSTAKFDDGESSTVTESNLQGKTFNTLLFAVGNLPKATLVIERVSFDLETPGKK